MGMVIEKLTYEDIRNYPNDYDLFKKELKLEFFTEEVFDNKTNRYLLPILKIFPEIFNCMLQLNYKAVGLGDNKFKELTGIDNVNMLHILVKPNKKFSAVINCLKQTKYYNCDYVYDKNYHMIVLDIFKHDKLVHVLKYFFKGEYHNMFKDKQLIDDIYKIGDILNEEIRLFGLYMQSWYVMTQYKHYRTFFVKFLKYYYNMQDYELHNNEVKSLDFPPIYKQEFFNFDFSNSANHNLENNSCNEYNF